MFWPLEKVPTTRPLLLMATDCSWPAAKPFCVMVLMVADPPELAYCVNEPLVILTVRLPSACPSTVTLGTAIAVPLGEASAPLELKMKFVPLLTQAACEPVAVVEV